MTSDSFSSPLHVRPSGINRAISLVLAIGGVAGALPLLWPTGSWSLVRWLVLAIDASIVVTNLRWFFSGVHVEPNGIVVRNYWRTHRLALDAVERFATRPSDQRWSAQQEPVLLLRDGSATRLDTLMPMFGGRWRLVESRLEMLNQALHHARSAAGPRRAESSS